MDISCVTFDGIWDINAEVEEKLYGIAERLQKIAIEF